MKLFSLLTCDEVHIDPQSGKHFILGHFSSIKVSKFPAIHPELTLFAALTEVPPGEHLLEVKFGPTPESAKTLLEQKLTSKGLAERLYSISTLTEIPFEKDGSVVFEIWVDKTLLGSTTLSASK